MLSTKTGLVQTLGPLAVDDELLLEDLGYRLDEESESEPESEDEEETGQGSDDVSAYCRPAALLGLSDVLSSGLSGGLQIAS